LPSPEQKRDQRKRISALRSALFTVAMPGIDNETPAAKLAVAEKHIVPGSFHAGRKLHAADKGYPSRFFIHVIIHQNNPAPAWRENGRCARP
jgi:hypothetical protein